MSKPLSSLNDLKVCQFAFRSPTKHPSQFSEDGILFILCGLFRIVFLKDRYFDIGHSLPLVP
jgi:hypothetical protein